MSINTYGRAFRVTTWGESHGPALGATVDGCPPGVPLDEGLVQGFLDRRRPGGSRFVTQRREPDTVEILSGVFEGATTGTPIQLAIRNADQRSKDYGDIADRFRPGHADIAYHLKYGVRDYRGGGRASARETAARVAGGAVARAALGRLAPGFAVSAYLVRMGELRVDRERIDPDEAGRNPLAVPDAGLVEAWGDYLDAVRKDGDSVGAEVEVVASGVPPGLGAPVHGKIDADLAAALMSINAVKGVEIGEGMAAAGLRGSQNADEITMGPEGPDYGSNHAGGVLGGITTGQPLVARFAVKPTSSILTPRRTITTSGEETELVTKGRHDPCVGIRAVPVAEAVMACVVLDHLLLDRGQTGGVRGRIGLT